MAEDNKSDLILATKKEKTNKLNKISLKVINAVKKIRQSLNPKGLYKIRNKKQLDDIEPKIKNLVNEFVEARLNPRKKDEAILSQRYRDFFDQEKQKITAAVKEIANKTRNPESLQKKVTEFLNKKDDDIRYFAVDGAQKLEEDKIAQIIGKFITINEPEKTLAPEKIEQEQPAQSITEIEQEQPAQSITEREQEQPAQSITEREQEQPAQSIIEREQEQPAQSNDLPKLEAKLKLLKQEIKYLEGKTEDPYKQLIKTDIKKLKTMVNDFRIEARPEETQKQRDETNGSIVSSLYGGIQGKRIQDFDSKKGRETQAQDKFTKTIENYLEDKREAMDKALEKRGETRRDNTLTPDEIQKIGDSAKIKLEGKVGEIAKEIIETTYNIGTFKRNSEKLTEAKKSPDKNAIIDKKKESIAKLTNKIKLNKEANIVGQEAQAELSQRQPTSKSNPVEKDKKRSR